LQARWRVARAHYASVSAAARHYVTPADRDRDSHAAAAAVQVWPFGSGAAHWQACEQRHGDCHVSHDLNLKSWLRANQAVSQCNSKWNFVQTSEVGEFYQHYCCLLVGLCSFRQQEQRIFDSPLQAYLNHFQVLKFTVVSVAILHK
jgi:hypothetical protein